MCNSSYSTRSVVSLGIRINFYYNWQYSLENACIQSVYNNNNNRSFNMVKTHAQPYKHIIHVYTYMFNTTKDSQDQLLYKYILSVCVTVHCISYSHSSFWHRLLENSLRRVYHVSSSHDHLLGTSCGHKVTAYKFTWNIEFHNKLAHIFSAIAVI